MESNVSLLMSGKDWARIGRIKWTKRERNSFMLDLVSDSGLDSGAGGLGFRRKLEEGGGGGDVVAWRHRIWVGEISGYRAWV